MSPETSEIINLCVLVGSIAAVVLTIIAFVVSNGTLSMQDEILLQVMLLFFGNIAIWNKYYT